MSEIKYQPFLEVIKDVTSKFTKIKKQDYLENGKYKIIDQSQNFIAGYTNNQQFINNDEKEIIIFGDHTRVIKYIDFPIAIGADGVKVLKVDSKIADTKYIYYFLKSVKLHNAGYSRHFKYLKAIKIPIQPLENQRKISSFLTRLEELIEKREKSIKLLDELIKSTFLDMFLKELINQENNTKLDDYIKVLTDYHANGSYKTLKEHVKLLTEPNYALMVRTTDLENNNFDNDCNYITKEAYEFLDKTKVYGGEIIINKIGSAGKVYLMPYLNKPVSLGMNAFLLRFNDDLNNIFAYYYLTSKIGSHRIQKSVKGAVTKTITKDAIRSIVIPKVSIELQNKFADIVIKIEDTKKHYQKSLDELTNLFNSTAQKAFKGEFDVSKIAMPKTSKVKKTDGKKKLKKDLQMPKASKLLSSLWLEDKMYKATMLQPSVALSSFFKSSQELQQKLQERKEHIDTMLQDIPQIKQALEDGVLSKEDFLELPLRFDFEYKNIKKIIMHKLATKKISQICFDDKDGKTKIKLVKTDETLTT